MKCCIIGLGVFGRNLARCLSQLGADVLVVDRKDENISAIKDLSLIHISSCTEWSCPLVASGTRLQSRRRPVSRSGTHGHAPSYPDAN